MIDINPKDSKELEFEVEIQNIDSGNLEGYLRLNIEGYEYGVPVEITSKYITVDIPPLTEIVKKELKSEEMISAKLDIYGEGFYLCPWNGEFKVTMPATVKVKLKEGYESPNIKVKESKKTEVKNKTVLKESKEVDVKNMKVTDKMIDLAMNKLGITNPTIKNTFLESMKLKVTQKYGEVDNRKLLKEIIKTYHDTHVSIKTT